MYFNPNKTPVEVAFGGTCFRDIYSGVNVSCDPVIFDTGPICTQKKKQIEQKVITIFIEN